MKFASEFKFIISEYTHMSSMLHDPSMEWWDSHKSDICLIKYMYIFCTYKDSNILNQIAKRSMVWPS